METVVTPEPHLIPGYTGHCPQLRFRNSTTYGKESHALFVSSCVDHSPELIVTPLNRKCVEKESPTQEEIDVLKRRQKYVDAIYRPPLIPGYDGFIPKMAMKTGERFLAAATASVAEFEALMEILRCEQRELKHRDILESGKGFFEKKVGERLMPGTLYRAPLVPVRPRAQAQKTLDCSYKEEKVPYSKFTVPHFMENDDEEKYIINGYGGHIPMAMTRYGMCNKALTNSALCEFINNYHHRRSAEWCPIESAGVATLCPSKGHFVIYHQNIGMVPSYAGHVPGETFTFGRTYGTATVDAKRWLAIHKK